MKKNNSCLVDLIKGLSAMRIGGRQLAAKCRVLKGVIIVGSSCSGKTTLINTISNSELCRSGKLSVPLRYTTRAKRKNDSPGENSYVSKEVFARMIRKSQLLFYWKKRFDSLREERFGFARLPAGSLPVYSGNNGLLYNKDSIYPSGILDSMLLIGIYAPDEVRKERLLKRSPDLALTRPEEIRYRIKDSSRDILDKVHFVINNYGSYMRDSKQNIIGLLGRICKFS